MASFREDALWKLISGSREGCDPKAIVGEETLSMNKSEMAKMNDSGFNLSSPVIRSIHEQSMNSTSMCNATLQSPSGTESMNETDSDMLVTKA